MKHSFLSRCLGIILLTGTLLSPFSWLNAQDLKPVSNSYIIKNATVVQSPGTTLQGAHVLIEDGLITAVGTNISVPVDAVEVEGDSLVVYAGFIDGLSHAGLPEPKRRERPDVKDPGNPPDEIAGITPYKDVREILAPEDKSVSSLRELGFTATHTVPYGNMLPGKGAIILLGGPADAMIFRENASLFSQFEGARGVYPNTLIGVMAKYRELYTQARYAKNDAVRYASTGTGMRRPANDRVLEAFYPVIDGKMPVVFMASGVKDVHRAMMLRDELGFNLVLAGVKQSWDVADAIKSNNVPLFLSLDLPEWKDEKRDSTLTGEEAAEYAGLYDRKQDVLGKYYTQVSSLSQMNIPFGFSTAGLKTSDFRKTILKMKEQGTTDDQLLAALTVAPARLLGLSRVMGTVEAGKMANLVVSDKNFFEEDAQVRYVFVEGTKYTMENKPKKKAGNGDKAFSPVGRWTFSADPGGAPATGVLEFSTQGDDLIGTMSYDQGGTTFDLSDVSLTGNTITFNVIVTDGGQNLSFTSTLTFDGDEYSGTVSSPQTGSFPINGKKIPE